MSHSLAGLCDFLPGAYEPVDGGSTDTVLATDPGHIETLPPVVNNGGGAVLQHQCLGGWDGVTGSTKVSTEIFQLDLNIQQA